MTAELWSLLASTFISSTILPGGSEVLLAYLANQQIHPITLLLAVATFGNTLGGLTTWGLGWLCAKKYSPQKFAANKRQQQAVSYLKRWGSPALLFSWLPIIGDPLCFAAGWLGTAWLSSVIYMLIGKATRYAIILGIVDWFI